MLRHQGWKPEDVKFFRHAYVKCILATDLALSLEYISKFQSLTNNMSARETAQNSAASTTTSGGIVSPRGPANGKHLKKSQKKKAKKLT